MVLEPASFGARKYDPIAQSFTWELYDQVDQLATMSLPFRDWSKDAIGMLEGLDPKQTSRWCIVARAARHDAVLSIEPVSILRPEVPDRPVFQLALDAMPAGAPQRRDATANEDDDEAPDEEELLEEAAGARHADLNRVISELNSLLLSIAEKGCQSAGRPSQEWLEKCQRDSHTAGLTLLAGVAGNLAGPTSIVPSDVLRARYLAHLHMQAVGQIM